MNDARFFILPNGYLVSVYFRPEGHKFMHIETTSRYFVVESYSQMVTAPFMDENQMIYDITFRADCKDLEELVI